MTSLEQNPGRRIQQNPRPTPSSSLIQSSSSQGNFLRYDFGIAQALPGASSATYTTLDLPPAIGFKIASLACNARATMERRRYAIRRRLTSKGPRCIRSPATGRLRRYQRNRRDLRESMLIKRGATNGSSIWRHCCPPYFLYIISLT